jgi:hypothetical protein
LTQPLRFYMLLFSFLLLDIDDVVNIDDLVKNPNLDGSVKCSRSRHETGGPPEGWGVGL